MDETFEFVEGKKSTKTSGPTPLSITCHICSKRVPVNLLDQHAKECAGNNDDEEDDDDLARSPSSVRTPVRLCRVVRLLVVV